MREMPTDELLTEIEKTREKIFRMRFQAKGKDLENPGLMKRLKKDVARMYTVLNERKGAAVAAASAPVAEPGVQEAGES
jgi:large subunit ribosomal protein L29